MREELSRNEVFIIVDSLVKEMMSQLQTSVYNKFIDRADAKFKKLNLQNFLSKDVLNGFFNNSTFMDIFESDPDYLFEFSDEYWAEHIVSEIEASIDLKRMANDYNSKNTL